MILEIKLVRQSCAVSFLAPHHNIILKLGFIRIDKRKKLSNKLCGCQAHTRVRQLGTYDNSITRYWGTSQPLTCDSLLYFTFTHNPSCSYYSSNKYFFIFKIESQNGHLYYSCEKYTDCCLFLVVQVFSLLYCFG